MKIKERPEEATSKWEEGGRRKEERKRVEKERVQREKEDKVVVPSRKSRFLR